VHNKFIDSPQDLEGKKRREKPPKPTAFLNLKFPKRKKKWYLLLLLHQMVVRTRA
jgi:hypothetical protein